MAVKRVIQFQDLDGNPAEVEYYFDLNQADALEMDVVHDLAQMDNPLAYLKKIVDDKDSRKLLALWKELLFNSVGKREGQLLIKGEEVVREFRHSGAYNQLLSELIESDDAGASFFVSIMPAEIQQKAAQEQTRHYSKEELLSMPDDQFELVAGTDIRNMSKEHMQIAMQRLTNSKAA